MLTFVYVIMNISARHHRHWCESSFICVRNHWHLCVCHHCNQILHVHHWHLLHNEQWCRTWISVCTSSLTSLWNVIVNCLIQLPCVPLWTSVWVIIDNCVSHHWHLCETPLTFIWDIIKVHVRIHWHLCEASFSSVWDVINICVSHHWHLCEAPLHWNLRHHWHLWEASFDICEASLACVRHHGRHYRLFEKSLTWNIIDIFLGMIHHLCMWEASLTAVGGIIDSCVRHHVSLTSVWGISDSCVSRPGVRHHWHLLHHRQWCKTGHLCESSLTSVWGAIDICIMCFSRLRAPSWSHWLCVFSLEFLFISFFSLFCAILINYILRSIFILMIWKSWHRMLFLSSLYT